MIAQVTDEDPDTNMISSFSTIPSTRYTSESFTTESISTSESMLPFTIEILGIYVHPGIGNAVKLVWGRQLDNVNLNMTYAVHYAKDGEDLNGNIDFYKISYFVKINQSK